MRPFYRNVRQIIKCTSTWTIFINDKNSVLIVKTEIYQTEYESSSFKTLSQPNMKL